MTKSHLIGEPSKGMLELADVCTRCDGKGWYWRTPDGFNPFLAGGFATARAMYRQPCGKCSALRQAASKARGEAQ